MKTQIFAMVSLCFLSSVAQAQGLCGKSWRIEPVRIQNNLQLTIQEVDRQGPACDFVVKSLNYIEGLSALTLDLAEVTCPLDAITSRKAAVTWQLPFALRSQTDLNLVINGQAAGILKVRSNEVFHEGNCQ